MASLVGRLAEAAVPLAVLLVARDRSGSVAGAGASVAALGIGFAVTTPVLGRLLDRLGVRRLLPVLCATHGAALIAIAGTGVRLPALALVAGATTPPLSAVLRAAWLGRLRDERSRTFVLGVEALVVEASFVLGPAAVSLLLLTATPATALVVLAGMTVVGGLGFTAPAGAAPAVVASGADVLGPLRSPGVRTLLAATAAFGIGEGVLQVAVVGAAGPQLAGVLLTTAAGASVAGGLLYVRRRHTDAARDFAAAHLAMAGGFVLVAVASGSDAALAAGLLVIGLAGSPVPITNSRLLALVSERRHATESATWLVVAVVVGGAIGSSAGGEVVERLGVPPALLVGATALTAGGAIAAARRASLRRP